MVRHPDVDVAGAETFGFWSVVRHHEAQQANRDWETFTAVDGPGLAPQPMYRDAEMIVAFDPPEHTRIRRLLSAGFTPRMIARLEADIERRSEKILDDVMARGDDVVEFVTEIAHELPMHVIADIVGIPDAIDPGSSSRPTVSCSTSTPTPASRGEGVAAQVGLFEYAQKLSDEKRAQPTDDIWTQLTVAEVVDDDGTATRLSGHQLDAFFMILSVAGSETTRNVLSQGIQALADQPEQFRSLRSEPDLVVPGADEVLRWASPVLMFTRTATRDVELGGAPVEQGDRVVIWYPSANRDEDVFGDPFRFDVRRTPNPHVAFGGGGPHYCLGREPGQEGDPGHAGLAVPPVRPDRGGG